MLKELSFCWFGSVSCCPILVTHWRLCFLIVFTVLRLFTPSISLLFSQFVSCIYLGFLLFQSSVTEILSTLFIRESKFILLLFLSVLYIIPFFVLKVSTFYVTDFTFRVTYPSYRQVCDVFFSSYLNFFLFIFHRFHFMSPFFLTGLESLDTPVIFRLYLLRLSFYIFFFFSYF